jgi:hypothetical protein
MTRETKTREPITEERMKQVRHALDYIVEHIYDGAVRIEVDIEYADGGRVKVEARA